MKGHYKVTVLHGQTTQKEEYSSPLIANSVEFEVVFVLFVD